MALGHTMLGSECSRRFQKIPEDSLEMLPNLEFIHKRKAGGGIYMGID